MYISVFGGVPHFSEAGFISLSFNLFSVCSLACIVSVDLPLSLLIFSSASLHVLLSPSSEFLPQLLYFLNCRVSVFQNNVYLYSLFAGALSLYLPLML